MRQIIAVAFLTLASASSNAALKIEKRVDALTKKTLTIARDLKVCQIKTAGMMAKCAALDLTWTDEMPDSIAVRITFPETVSVQQLAINMNGEVQRFDATTAVTDFNYDKNLPTYTGSGASSGNTFLVPVTALRSLCKDADSGIMRVSGTHSSIDFDFWRQAKMKGVPADELRQFLDAVVPANPTN